jgi:hypothetical protein
LGTCPIFMSSMFNSEVTGWWEYSPNLFNKHYCELLSVAIGITMLEK